MECDGCIKLNAQYICLCNACYFCEECYKDHTMVLPDEYHSLGEFQEEIDKRQEDDLLDLIVCDERTIFQEFRPEKDPVSESLCDAEARLDDLCVMKREVVRKVNEYFETMMSGFDREIESIQNGGDRGDIDINCIELEEFLEILQNEFRVNLQLPFIDHSLVVYKPITNCIERYSIMEESYVESIKGRIHQSCSVAVDKDYLYITGGSAALQDKPDCFAINVQTGELRSLSPLNIPRSSHASIVYKGSLHAIGGSAKESAIQSVERIHLEQGNWRTDLLLNRSRKWPGACIHKGKLYVAGGTETSSIEILNDHKFEEYTLSLGIPGSCGMASYDNSIFLFHKKGVFKYDDPTGEAKLSHIVKQELSQFSLASCPVLFGEFMYFATAKAISCFSARSQTLYDIK